ncbi:hypothetical protein LXL04_006619 [Taraxacum kok-saghyz]
MVVEVGEEKSSERRGESAWRGEWKSWISESVSEIERLLAAELEAMCHSSFNTAEKTLLRMDGGNPLPAKDTKLLEDLFEWVGVEKKMRGSGEDAWEWRRCDPDWYTRIPDLRLTIRIPDNRLTARILSSFSALNL